MRGVRRVEGVHPELGRDPVVDLETLDQRGVQVDVGGPARAGVAGHGAERVRGGSHVHRLVEVLLAGADVTDDFLAAVQVWPLLVLGGAERGPAPDVDRRPRLGHEDPGHLPATQDASHRPLRVPEKRQLVDEARHERVLPVEVGEAVAQLPARGGPDPAVVVGVVLRAAQGVGVRPQEAVGEAPVQLDLQGVVPGVGLGPAGRRGRASELGKVGPARVVEAGDQPRVELQTRQHAVGPVGHVGQLDRELQRELPLEGHVPGVDLSFREVEGHHVVLLVQKQAGVGRDEPVGRDVRGDGRREARGH